VADAIRSAAEALIGWMTRNQGAEHSAPAEYWALRAALAQQPAQGEALYTMDEMRAYADDFHRSRTDSPAQPAQGDPELDGLMESDFTTALEAQAWRSGFKAGNMKQPAQVDAVGEVYRYGKDSQGRPWHGIHWYDANVNTPHGTKLYTAPPAPSASVPMAPPAAFSEWLRSNMPPDTIISDPDWWAMAIWSAARRAINAAPVASGGKPTAPEPPRCTP